MLKQSDPGSDEHIVELYKFNYDAFKMSYDEYYQSLVEEREKAIKQVKSHSLYEQTFFPVLRRKSQQKSHSPGESLKEISEQLEEEGGRSSEEEDDSVQQFQPG